MAWIQRAVCDKCRAEKKEANHWFEALLVGKTDPNRLEITVVPMGIGRILPSADGLLWQCFCGAPCLLKQISEVLEGMGSVPIAEAPGDHRMVVG